MSRKVGIEPLTRLSFGKQRNKREVDDGAQSNTHTHTHTHTFIAVLPPFSMTLALPLLSSLCRRPYLEAP
jgi:hypothetical protein